MCVFTHHQQGDFGKSWSSPSPWSVALQVFVIYPRLQDHHRPVRQVTWKTERERHVSMDLAWGTGMFMRCALTYDLLNRCEQEWTCGLLGQGELWLANFPGAFAPCFQFQFNAMISCGSHCGQFIWWHGLFIITHRLTNSWPKLAQHGLLKSNTHTFPSYKFHYRRTSQDLNLHHSLTLLQPNVVHLWDDYLY